MENGEVVPGSFFVYAPNRIAPICFAVAYGISAIGHIWQCFYYKSFRLIGLHPLCAVLFTAGYALREVSAYNYIYDETNNSNLIIYVLSQVFIFICPPLLELANYHVLGRIFAYIPQLAPLPANRVLTIFGGLMMLVEALNAVGVAISSNPSSSNQGLGSNLTIAALALQLFVILTFALMASIFLHRCLRTHIRPRAVMTPLIILYISMALILIRCVYRLVEHLGNTTVHLSDPESLKNLTPILRYEWYFYVFEASLMLVNSAIWNIWNPGRYLPRRADVHLAMDGRTEVQGGEGTEGQHGVLEGMLAVFTFGLSAHLMKKGRRRDKGGAAAAAAEGRGQERRDAEVGGAQNANPVARVFLAILTFGLSEVLLMKNRSDKRTSEVYEELNGYPRDSP